MTLNMRPQTSVHLLTETRSLISKDKAQDSSLSDRNESTYLRRREQVRKAQRYSHALTKPWNFYS